MNPFRHIAAGTDGTDGGKDAVTLAAVLASAQDGGLSLVNVFPTPLFPTRGTTDRATLRNEAETNLANERDELAPQALIHAIPDLSVTRALSHFAEREHVGTVVIGSAANGPSGRTRIGRHGRQLLSNMPFSLALARRGSHDQPVSLGRIGVGYDGGPEAAGALAAAAQLALGLKATLVVVSVLDDRLPPLASAAAGSEWLAAAEMEGEWEPERLKTQAETERVVSELGVDAEVRAVLGDPAAHLRELSETVDLIIVGSRHWGPVARLVTGAVGETLVADAGCSVMITPRVDA